MPQADINRPHLTAIARRAPTAPLAALLRSSAFQVAAPRRILDFGCGRSVDAVHLAALGFDAVRFDPHPGFGADSDPGQDFDLVLLTYVLNVLDEPTARLAALQDAAGRIWPGGLLLATVRSAAEIDGLARQSGWPRHADGYWSRRGQFQHGFTQPEFDALLEQAGLMPEQQRLSVSNAICRLARKPA
jgi:SAM-dependent methyltransferase